MAAWETKGFMWKLTISPGTNFKPFVSQNNLQFETFVQHSDANIYIGVKQIKRYKRCSFFLHLAMHISNCIISWYDFEIFNSCFPISRCLIVDKLNPKLSWFISTDSQSEVRGLFSHFGRKRKRVCFYDVQKLFFISLKNPASSLHHQIYCTYIIPQNLIP